LGLTVCAALVVQAQIAAVLKRRLGWNRAV